MKDERYSYEAPEAQVFVLKMDGGILQDSSLLGDFDANRDDYGDAIPVAW